MINTGMGSGMLRRTRPGALAFSTAPTANAWYATTLDPIHTTYVRDAPLSSFGKARRRSQSSSADSPHLNWERSWSARSFSGAVRGTRLIAPTALWFATDAAGGDSQPGAGQASQ